MFDYTYLDPSGVSHTVQYSFSVPDDEEFEATEKRRAWCQRYAMCRNELPEFSESVKGWPRRPFDELISKLYFRYDKTLDQKVLRFKPLSGFTEAQCNQALDIAMGFRAEKHEHRAGGAAVYVARYAESWWFEDKPIS